MATSARRPAENEPVRVLVAGVGHLGKNHARVYTELDGVVLEGVPVEEVGQQLFDLMIEVASGKKTKSELHGVGEEEFIPWSIGATL